jgi:hypothetical protein
MNFLSMNVYINAWLDCSHPFISIHNKFDDDVLLHFNEDKVNQLFDSGDLCIDDFQNTDSDHQLTVIAELLAIQSNERIKIQLAELHGGLKRRAPKAVTKFPNQIAIQTTKTSKQIIPISTLQAVAP